MVLLIRVSTKWSRKRKWDDREYNIQYKEDLNDADMNISGVTAEFPAVQFYGL